MSARQRRSILSRLGPSKCHKLRHSFKFWARTDQYWQPGPEKFTLYMAGRGWGKTFCGQGATNESAEYRAEEIGGEIAIIGKSPKAVRDDMIEGPSGIIKQAPPWFKPKFYPSKSRVVWPNGVVAHTYSAHNPADLRGPNVGFLWADEAAHWAYPEKCWDEGVEMFLRHGRAPKCVITTTPLAIDLIRNLVKDPQVRVVHGNTADNIGNVAGDYIARVYGRFAGTDLALQELEGRLLDGNKRALWKHGDIIRMPEGELPGLFRTVVAVDPAGGGDDSNDETGIIVAAIDDRENFYVLEDCSGRYSANEWAERALHAANTWGADAIVGEANFGGDLVEANIRNNPLYDGHEIEIVRATKSKGYRASPVAAIYQQGRGYHVSDDISRFAELEGQMVKFDPTVPRRSQGWSPDRMDALVWAAIALLADGDDQGTLRAGTAGALEELFDQFESSDGDGDDPFDGW